MEITAKLNKILYESPTGYMVCLYKQEKSAEPDFTAVGTFLPNVKGMRVILEGEYVRSKYGIQFKVENFTELEPKGKTEIINYILSSGLSGIGNVKAENIYKTFGEKTIEVLDNHFEDICKVKGLPKKPDNEKIQNWKERWKDTRQLREALKILTPETGISPKLVQKIAKYFGKRLSEIISDNPYQILKIRGVSFQMADEVAKKQNVAANDPNRIKAGIKYTLLCAMNSGHLFLTADVLVREIYKLPFNNVPVVEIKKIINDMCASKELCYTPLGNNVCAIYLYTNYHNEEYVAKKLVQLLSSNTNTIKSKDNLLKIISDKEKQESIVLAEKQKQAVLNVFNYKVSIITGGPGRGKTTVINTIIDTYKTVYKNKQVVLIAPTGRAARKMSESTGEPSSTIHKALELTTTNEENSFCVLSEDEEDVHYIEADLIIADECSMIDQTLMARLMLAITVGTRVVFVGDVDQLPSVGPGNVFKEMIQSKIIPTTVLDVPFRQSEGDTIYKNAEKINAGDTNLEFDENFQMIEISDINKIQEECVEIYQEEFKNMGEKKALEQLWLLSPFRRTTVIGTNELNNRLRDVINPPGQALNGSVKMELNNFRNYDKVMNTINKDEVSNGDMGQIISIHSSIDGSEESSVVVDFGSSIGQVEYEKSCLENLELAYASTIHKSQGSECDVIIIPMAQCFSVMLKRNLIYTAVSRAKKRVYIVGEKYSFLKGIQDNSYAQRNTLLAARIIKEAKKINLYLEKDDEDKKSSVQLEFDM